jgi:hypothetical protein
VEAPSQLVLVVLALADSAVAVAALLESPLSTAQPMEQLERLAVVVAGVALAAQVQRVEQELPTLEQR